MAVITGNATRFDNGGPVDYIMIFDWETGSRIGNGSLTSTGEWTFKHNTSIVCGITYVADGLAPVTHGPYSFVETAPVMKSGYVLISYGVPQKYYDAIFDVSIQGPLWDDNFADFAAMNVYDYRVNANTLVPTTTIEYFNMLQTYKIMSRSWGSGTYQLLLEFLDVNDNIVAVIKAATKDSSSSGLYYSTNGTSFNAGVNSDWASYPEGIISFTDSQLIFTNTHLGGSYVGSFSFAVDVLNIVKIRVSGSSSISSSGELTGGYVKLLPLA